MAPGRFRRLSAAIACAALLWVLSTPTAPAGAAASWGGRVFESDRATPRAGVVVSLADDQGERTLRSRPTREDGAFNIDAASPGTYRVTVEASEGVFVLPEPLQLDAGENAPLALALKAAPFDAKRDHGLGKGGVKGSKPLIYAGVISAAALLVILEITKDEDEIDATIN